MLASFYSDDLEELKDRLALVKGTPIWNALSIDPLFQYTGYSPLSFPSFLYYEFLHNKLVKIGEKDKKLFQIMGIPEHLAAIAMLCLRSCDQSIIGERFCHLVLYHKLSYNEATMVVSYLARLYKVFAKQMDNKKPLIHSLRSYSEQHRDHPFAIAYLHSKMDHSKCYEIPSNLSHEHKLTILKELELERLVLAQDEPSLSRLMLVQAYIQPDQALAELASYYADSVKFCVDQLAHNK